MAAPEITDKFTLEGLLAVLVAVGGLLAWAGRKVFLIGEKSANHEQRLSNLEAGHAHQDAQIAEINRAITAGLQRIEDTNKSGMAELHRRVDAFYQTAMNRQGGD